MQRKNGKKRYIIGMLMGMVLLGNNLEARSKIIQVKGSDTILNVSQKIVEEYVKENKKERIAVTGGGSGVGISSLLNGTTSIAMASRNIKLKELEMAKKKDKEIKEIVLGYDGINIIVNKNNSIDNLDEKTLGKIYRGEIKDWSELGRKAGEIVVLSRDSSSGTHEFFKEHVVRERNTKKDFEYGIKTLYMPSTEAIKQEVESNENAIGYIGMGYIDDKSKVLTINGVEATLENISQKKYPLAREVYWYTVNKGKVNIDKLVDYAMSKEGQEIVKEEGFVPANLN